MPLKISHNAFYGSCAAFNRMRQFVCAATGSGGSFPPHYHRDTDGAPLEPIDRLRPDWWYIDGDIYGQDTHPGLWEFFNHSDCNGEISPEMCINIANELEALLPAMEAMKWLPVGHAANSGGYIAVVRQFIAGCRAAAAAGEPLLFQ